MKRLALSALALVALVSACKKDSTDTPTPSAKVALLVNKRWGLTALTAQQGSVTKDGYATLRPCEKDDYLRFNDDRTAEANEGPLKCNTSDAQSQAGTWELISNETKLLLTTPLLGTGGAGTPDIVELSSTRMVLRGTVIDNNVTTTYTATLTPY